MPEPTNSTIIAGGTYAVSKLICTKAFKTIEGRCRWYWRECHPCVQANFSIS